jgi:hypothetical protein
MPPKIVQFKIINMINYNVKYIINNGQDSIVFTQGNENTVNGQYSAGTITGTIDDNVFKGTFYNQKSNSAGLIELTFQEISFIAKWKQGIEPGPMRGKWNGKLKVISSTSAQSEKHKIKLARHLSTDTSTCIGSQIAIGILDNSQVKELLTYLDAKEFMNNKYLNDIQDYNELYHRIGIPFSPEFNSLIDLADDDAKSFPEDLVFEFDEYEDIITKEQDSFCFVDSGFYLISIRFEDFYMLKEAEVESIENSRIQPGIDKLPIVGVMLMGDPSFYQLNTFWLNDMPMDSADEDGDGNIYSTYQILYYYDGRELTQLDDAYSLEDMLEILGNENIIMYSNRTDEAPSIVSSIEDISPLLIDNNELDEGTLSLKIENLKQVLNNQ